MDLRGTDFYRIWRIANLASGCHNTAAPDRLEMDSFWYRISGSLHEKPDTTLLSNAVHFIKVLTTWKILVILVIRESKFHKIKTEPG